MKLQFRLLGARYIGCHYLYKCKTLIEFWDEKLTHMLLLCCYTIVLLDILNFCVIFLHCSSVIFLWQYWIFYDIIAIFLVLGCFICFLHCEWLTKNIYMLLGTLKFQCKSPNFADYNILQIYLIITMRICIIAYTFIDDKRELYN